MEFSNTTHMVFEPLPESVAVDGASSAVYTTPADHRPKLADLARLSYLGGRARVSVVLNQGSAGGSATVKLTDGTTDLVEWSVDLSGAQRQHFASPVDISGVNGDAPLRFVLDVDGAADAGTEAQVAGVLEVLHPVVIVPGCG